ncbi:MAG: ABC transporter permease, partial [Comamonadaceae bacterium]
MNSFQASVQRALELIAGADPMLLAIVGRSLAV